MMTKKRVLFVCVHNSARSQMAEAFLNKYGGDRYEAESAGLEPGQMNPVVVEVMKEVGIDISGKSTTAVADCIKEGRQYDYVITVCDGTNGARCPVFPGNVERLHWGFDDPSPFSGTHEEKCTKTRPIRDKIEKKILQWLE